MDDPWDDEVDGTTVLETKYGAHMLRKLIQAAQRHSVLLYNQLAHALMQEKYDFGLLSELGLSDDILYSPPPYPMRSVEEIAAILKVSTS